jgi:hypothetical protein
VVAAAGTVGLGLVVTGLLVVVRPLIGAVLGQAEPGAVLIVALGAAMSLGASTALLVNAAVARGVARPWPAIAVAIVALAVFSRSSPDPLSFAVGMLVAQAGAAVLSLGPALHGKLRAP